MSTILRAIGWILVAGSVAAGVVLAILDFRLLALRRGDVGAWRYWVTPFKYEESLYHGEGPQLVRQVWRVMGLMFGLAVGGFLLLVFIT